MTIRVLIVDDQDVVRTGFRTILSMEEDIEVVGEASDGHEAVQRARRLRPDLTLMDVRMPRLDGIEATRRLAGPGTADPMKVVVLTTFDLDEYVYAALQAGASGFLLKDIRRDQLIDAVRVITQGDAILAPSITQRLITAFARNAPPKDATAKLDRLTPREREILILVARGNTNPEIAGTLHISPETVKSHVTNLLTKLDLRDRVQAVIFAYESGFIHTPT